MELHSSHIVGFDLALPLCVNQTFRDFTINSQQTLDGSTHFIYLSDPERQTFDSILFEYTFHNGEPSLRLNIRTVRWSLTADTGPDSSLRR